MDAIRLRVHFAPVGFEVLRVADPLKDLHADVALLMIFSQTDRARFQLESIKKLLKDNRVKTHVIECNLWSISEVVNEVGAVVAASPYHEFFYNVSTGTRTASIAGVMASMLWHVRPYYVSVDENAEPVHSERDFPVRGLPQFIPTFEVAPLDRYAVAALDYIAGSKEPVSKRLLLEHLTKGGFVGPRKKSAVSPQALYGQLDSILAKLRNWGFVEFDGRGKQVLVKVTDGGIEGRKMFLHILNPMEPLGVLSKKV